MALTIGALILGRDKPHAISPTATLTHAVEQMLRFDFTQLPVTDESERLLGVITSDSILRALEAFGLPIDRLTVGDALIRAQWFDRDGDASDLLNALRDEYAAFVVDGEKRLVGIITGFDASEYFRKRSEDTMLVEDIESSIKEHVLAAFQDASGKVDQAKLDAVIAVVGSPSKQLRGRLKKAISLYHLRSGIPGSLDAAVVDGVLSECTDTPKGIAFEDLTLSQYIDVLLHESTWSAYADVFGVESEALRKLLYSVRDIRNSLAHFRGEITATERERLRYCAAWLDRHPPRRIAEAERPATVTAPVPGGKAEDIVPVDERIDPGEGRYAKLAVWLQTNASGQEWVELTFNQVEEILGGPLPNTAREHRSWWANDNVRHPQSKQWLEVGWRTSFLSLTDETVTFSRVEERQASYISFFSRVIDALEKSSSFAVRRTSPSGISWHELARLPETGDRIGILVCSFARGERLRMEFYIDVKDRALNKLAFDRLAARRTEIEQRFGSSLSWERLDDRRACRIAAYTDGAVTADDETLKRLVSWTADAASRLYVALAGPVEEVATELPDSPPVPAS